MTTLYDIPQNSYQPEILINANTKAVSAAGLFSEKKISGLNWYYFGGDYVNITGFEQTINDGFITCTANKNIYVMFDLNTSQFVKNEVDISVAYNDSNFTNDNLKIAYLTTNTTQIVSSVNKKVIPLFPKGKSPLFSTVQQNSDWNSTSGVTEILNKPDLSNFITKDNILAGSNITLNKIGNDTTISADSISIQSVGTSVTSDLSTLNFNDSFVLTETTAGTILIETTHNKLETKNEGVLLSSNTKSIDFVGDAVAATHSGNDTTVTINKNKLTIKDEGTALTTDASSINFFGTGVTATTSGNDVTVTINGGGGGGINGITIKDEGTVLTTNATALDFTGNLVTATGSGDEKTIKISDNTAIIILNSNFTITAGQNTLYTQITDFNYSLLANKTYEIEFYGIATTSAPAAAGVGFNFFCTDNNAFAAGIFNVSSAVSGTAALNIPIPNNYQNSGLVSLNTNGELAITSSGSMAGNLPNPIIIRGIIKPTTNCTFYIKARTSDTANPTTRTATLFAGATLKIKQLN